MSFLRRHRKKLFFGTLIGLPAIGVAAGGAYVQYRVMTRPPEHTFQPLVDASGRLQLADCVIPAPTRIELFLRILRLFTIFTPVLCLYVWVMWDEKHLRWWLVKLRDAVEIAGPAYVKMGQWSCTRNDLFSPLFREVFQTLFSEAKVHTYEETRRIIFEDMGKEVEDVFDSMEPVPIGSGSIGQVHDARLKSNGRRVAVKVMHPSVIETIAKDFFVINSVAYWVHKYARSLEHYDIRKLALAWTNHLAAQLDFRIEFEHLHLFRQHFMNTDYVEFPEPIDCTQRVLIEEYVHGEAATPEFLGKQEPHIRDILAGKGLNSFCKMIMRDNFLHGDLHPGNILVNTRDPQNPVVYLIDVGLCQKMTGREGELNHDLMGAFVRWQPQLASDTLWNMASTQEFSDKEKFDGDMRDLFKKFRPVSGDESEVITNVLQAIFDVIRANRVTMDPAHVNILFAVLVLEGFIMALNENYNMVRHSSGWLVSEGHMSGSLLRNSLKAGKDVMVVELSKIRSKLFGARLEDQENFVPAHRERLAARLRAEQMAELEEKNSSNKLATAAA